MIIRSLKWWLFVILGFYFFAVLSVLPLPNNLQWFRPQWLLLFVIFCQLKQPTLFGMGSAWLLGLLMDALLGGRLGENALIFSLIYYLTALLRPRFATRPMWTQIGKVFLLVCLAQVLALWFHVMVGKNPHTLFYWASTFTSCLAWPLMMLLLRKPASV